MSADIVPFGRKVPKKVKGAFEGVELNPPSSEDLAGFIGVLNFLGQQSATNSLTIDLSGDELTITIHHHDDFSDEDNSEVMSMSSLEFIAGGPFNPQDVKKTSKILLAIFDRLNIDNHDDDETK